MIKRLMIASILLAAPLLAGVRDVCQAPAPQQFADEGGEHVEQCSPLTHSHYPPTSGQHYPNWAMPGAYEAVVNAGNWLHAAEHGAVIFLINCRTTGDCKADFARLKSIADAYPRDSLCSVTDNHRIVISGDTLITTRFAVVAWNWSMLSDCLDSTAFAAFLHGHYAHGPENICGGGTDFSGSGWCNAPLGLAFPGRNELQPAAPGRNAGPGTRAWSPEETLEPYWPGLPAGFRPDGRSCP